VQTFAATTENIEALILNVNYKVGDYGNLVGYGYWLNYTEIENYEKIQPDLRLAYDKLSKPGLAQGER
jgi:hypothetical protein